MTKIKIKTTGRYHVTSFGNGTAYEITRVSDGASVLLQGDDAVQLESEIESANSRYTADDVCGNYDEVMEVAA